VGVTAVGEVQTITCKGPYGPARGANPDWYAIRRNTERAQEAHNKLQVIYQPPLGIFQYRDPMGSGQYKITLGPNSNYRLAMVETQIPDFNAIGADSRYTINIKGIRFYAQVAKLAIPDSIATLNLTEWQAQSKTIGSTSGDYQFTVPQSTEIIYVALQGAAAGSNPAMPPNRFVAPINSGRNLKLLLVRYGGQRKPQTRWSSEFTGSTNHLQQFYQNTLVETMQQNNPGPCESFNDWLSRGPVYAFRFDRTRDSRDTEVTVQIAYEDSAKGAFDTTSKLFVIAEFRRTTTVTHSLGSIVEVSSLNA
jgi:hypothetical protein